jgi:hypothetical protein
MPERLTMGLTLPILAVRQYGNFNFNSFCKLGDLVLGANESGIFVLEDGDTDNGTKISAFIELPVRDFGISNLKRLRKAYIGLEADGVVRLLVKNDEHNERVYKIIPSGFGDYQEAVKVPIGADGKGRYWSFRIENQDGCDFGIDSLEVVPIVLSRKPSRR